MNLLQKIKNKTFEIFETEKSDDTHGWLYMLDDYFISGLIILNVIAIILESFEPVYAQFRDFFFWFEFFSVAVFSVEYLLRLWVADMHFQGGALISRLKYIFSPMGLVDLLAILPFYLPMLIKFDLRMLRMLRLLRLVRIFKLAHYSSSVRLIYRVLKDKKEELIITVAASFILLLLAATLMYHVEKQIQPDQFPNIFAALWWAVATLTTIGYGDVYPVTAAGKVLAAFTALFGIGLVAIPTGLISMGFMEEIQKSRQDEKEEEHPKYCPHCGKKLRE